MALQSTFQQWFTLLIKHRLPGAALGVAGLGVGLTIMFSTIELPSPANDEVRNLSLALMWGSAILFVLAGFFTLVCPTQRARTIRPR
jgi:hypothetical protein